jgi:hypothetical protein
VTALRIGAGEVLRYHPILGCPDFVRVLLLSDAYALGNGELIVKARRLDNDRFVWPGLCALTEDRDG